MKHNVFRILAGLVLLAAIAGIGFFAFNAGVAHGAALDLKPLIVEGQQVQPPAAMPMYGGPGMMFHHRMPFMGFGCFGILVPLFLLFLVFGAMRHLFGGHRIHLHGHLSDKADWDKDLPPFFAEWHRRAHAEPSAEKTDQ